MSPKRNPKTRRNVLQTMAGIGTASIGATGVIGSVNGESESVVTALNEDSVTYTDDATDSETGGDPYGEGEFKTTLASGIIKYRGVWRPSIDAWEFDYSLSGITENRFTNDNSPAERMWWQEAYVNKSDATNFDALYTRDDSNWVGVKEGSGNSPVDYSSYDNVKTAASIALGVLNPAAGTAYAVSDFVEDLIHQWYQRNRVSTKWYFDTTAGPDDHHTGHYFKLRAELNKGNRVIFDINDIAAAYGEHVVSNKFSIISYGSTTTPNSLSTQERRQQGIRRVTPSDRFELAGQYPRLVRKLDEEDGPIYVSTKPRTKIVHKGSEVPEHVREEIKSGPGTRRGLPGDSKSQRHRHH